MGSAFLKSDRGNSWLIEQLLCFSVLFGLRNATMALSGQQDTNHLATLAFTSVTRCHHLGWPYDSFKA